MTKTIFIDFLKTLSLHLLCTLIFCNLYEGFFLFFFPPLLVIWLLICLLLSLSHRIIHRRVLRHYFKDDLLVQLWLKPLVFLCGSLVSTLGLFSLMAQFGHAGLLRQLCQLPVELFSRFIYVYFLLIFSSGTYLFVELVLFWSPRLKSHHFSKKTKTTGRKMLGILGVILVGGVYYISSFKKNNLIYLRAALTSNLGGNWKEATALFQKISKENKSLYLNSRYRLGKIHLHRFHRYDQALNYFQEIIDELNSPISDDAIYQSILCFLQKQETSSSIVNFLDQSRLGRSCLKDEIDFMLARKYEDEKKWDPAQKLYEKLIQEPGYGLTLVSFSNSTEKQVFRTLTLAQEKLNSLEGLK